MATIFNNGTNNGAVTLVAVNDTLILGGNAYWTLNSSASFIVLQGSNLLRNAGQVYADARAVSGASFMRIENLATGVMGSSTTAAIALIGNSTVVNAGHVSGTEAIAFTGAGNTVVNTGTLIGSLNTVDFGLGSGTDEVVNSGTIVSTGDDAIEFGTAFANRVDNSGGITAFDTAIFVSGSGTTTIVNSGTISGGTALLLGVGADTVINSGVISGASFLGDGDDLYDSAAGIMFGTMSGGDGEDTLIGGTAIDRLSGGSGDDLLVGNGGNDALTGGTGEDELDGGEGRDTALYLEGAVLADLADPSRNTGSAAGDLYVSIENLTGGASSDELYGNAVRNVLRGGAGADVLDGRGGADRMIGGTGDDQYGVDDVRDRITEFAGEGTDVVRASISYTLGAEVENLTLVSNAAVNATGNAAANILAGNGATNVLAGGLGNDILTGGGGADIFRFDTALDAATNVDLINDFTSGIDRINLSRAIFTALGGGQTLAANAFVSGVAAVDGNDRIIHDAATGSIFYDADGNGWIVQVEFARIGIGQPLTAADFGVIG